MLARCPLPIWYLTLVEHLPFLIVYRVDIVDLLLYFFSKNISSSFFLYILCSKENKSIGLKWTNIENLIDIRKREEEEEEEKSIDISIQIGMDLVEEEWMLENLLGSWTSRRIDL